MKNFFSNLAVKFQRFMYGRYGIDELYRFLVWLYFILAIVFMFIQRLIGRTPYLIISTLLFGIIIFAFCRVFSKNIEKRKKENANWLNFVAPIKKKFRISKDRFKYRKEYVFKKCPNCKVVLRLKRKKGKHSVCCPHCKETFNIRVH